jgi:hypothetical protein
MLVPTQLSESVGTSYRFNLSPPPPRPPPSVLFELFPFHLCLLFFSFDYQVYLDEDSKMLL